MKRSRLAILGLRHYWRTSLTIAAGMAVGTAVLAGALIVGDSVRGSLRDLTLERLGRIDYALSGPRFFGESLAAGLGGDADFAESFSGAVPAILLRGLVRNADGDQVARGVNVIGVDARFWEMAVGGARPGEVAPPDDRVVLNRSLAEEIGITGGGDAPDVLISVERPSDIPAEAVYGDREDTTVTIRAPVGEVIANAGLGRFDLTPTQHLPFNIYMPLERLQRQLDRRGEINSILVAGAGDPARPGPDLSAALHTMLGRHASARDLGLRVRVNAEPPYVSVESLQMLLRESDIEAIEAAAAEIGAAPQGAFAYLANTITNEGREIPYSMIAAIDTDAPGPLGPLRLADGSPAPALGPGEILINTWAAERLEAAPGQEIRFTYYIDGPKGRLLTRESGDFVLRGIVAIEGAGRDPGLTPEYPGVHDAADMSDWNPPFPVELDRVGDEDEAYWDEYSTTPKAYISLAQGSMLWSSRFGKLTSIRLPAIQGESLEATADLFSAALRRHLAPETAGLGFRPVKLQGLEASAGASDFGMLFMGFSFFIIVSAILLVRLLFSLSVERRAREIGLLLAAGYSGHAVRRLFLREGLALALAGAVMGLALGAGYAAVMLHGLRTWWVGSVGTTFLTLHLTPLSLALGLAAGVLSGLLSVFLAVRTLTRAQPARLISGSAAIDGGLDDPEKQARAVRRDRAIALVAGGAALGALFLSPMMSAGAMAALFYTGGASILLAAMFALSAWMRPRREDRTASLGGGVRGLGALGARNAARHRTRSLSTVALVASATFIIVAVASMTHEGGHAPIARDSGNGGFALIAESGAPLLFDLNAPEDRDALNLNVNPEEEALLAASRFHPFRLQPGEDASCLNLYRPQRPRILGADPEFIQRGGFRFQASLAETDEEKANPWLLLDRPPDEEGAAPAIGDATTIMWILKSGLGKVLRYEDDRGNEIKLRIVGMLKKSALQSELVISGANFIRPEFFPASSGWNFYFIETPAEAAGAVQAALEGGLREYGMDVQGAQERIDRYQAVENTYLSTFLALGGLGLILGTLGLGTAMLRSVLERRGELALLRAVGYRSVDISTLVMVENAALLLAGLGIGAGSALISVAPTLMAAGSAMPWGALGLTLAGVIAAGLISGSIAVAAAVRTPILASLRAG